MTESDKSSSLKDLEARLRNLKASTDQAAGRSPSKDNSRNGLGFAMRLGVELVSALAIGVGIGLLLDYWLETTPCFMLLFFILGSVAGFMNVYRAATGIGQGVGYRPANTGQKTGQTSPEDQADADRRTGE